MLMPPRHDPSVIQFDHPLGHVPPPHPHHPSHQPFGRQCAVAQPHHQSPIFVLDEMLRAGQQPPPMVIQCAIAEAEMLGQYELASDIIHRFVAPLVQEHAGARGGGQAPPQREQAREQVPQQRRAAAGAGTQAQPFNEDDYELDEFARPRPRAKAPTQAPTGSPIGAETSAPAKGVSDAEMQQAVNAAMGLDNTGMPRQGGQGSDGVQKKQKQGQGGATQDPGTMVGGTIVGGALGAMNWGSSPIAGVDPANWGGFVGRVSREAPTYSTKRHVGQFRQRRERLEDLGFSPDEVATSAGKQLAALEADMRDAYHHAQDGGLLDYVGKGIATPPVGGEPAGKHTVRDAVRVARRDPSGGDRGGVRLARAAGRSSGVPAHDARALRTNGVL